ncbi:MAG TPA: malonyl-[acyl-carrier protein] O-methyltransferase BioC [Oceanospirillaceae bacterium]|nr:malonyl-[acyl-carrier protein] O-methyltransferase BioC [Oceanospirillaceae bacterium]
MSSLPSVAQVAQAFSQAARHYDAVAGLQRQAADHLIGQCASNLRGQVLDIGCGTGYLTRQVLQQAAVTQVLGVDVAEGMLDWCREHISDARCDWLQADAQALPLADSSLDGVVSSLAIQWCADEQALFSNISRVLRSDGRLFATTLGPDTLSELRWAWQQVDDFQHVNEFVPQAELLHAVQPYFSQIDIQVHTICLKFDKVSEILRELKQLGASNHNLGASRGLTTGNQLRSMTAAYESLRDEQGKLPVSYQIYTINAQQPLACHCEQSEATSGSLAMAVL